MLQSIQLSVENIDNSRLNTISAEITAEYIEIVN